MEDVLGLRRPAGDRHRGVVRDATRHRILVELGAEVIGVDVKPTAVDVAEFLEVDLRDKAAIEAGAAKVRTPVNAFFSSAGLPGLRSPTWT